MRKAALFATALAFVGADMAAAAPVPMAATGKAVISNSTDDLTLVRAKKKRARKAPAGAPVTPAGGAADPSASRAIAPNVANPPVTPSGQSPAVDQGMRARSGGTR